MDWDAALLVVEDRDELESRAKFFVVLARRGHAYVVGVLNEPFDSRNAESELAECESSVVAMTRRASCGWRSSPGDFRPHAHTTRVCSDPQHIAHPRWDRPCRRAKNLTILALTSTFDRKHRDGRCGADVVQRWCAGNRSRTLTAKLQVRRVEVMGLEPTTSTLRT